MSFHYDTITTKMSISIDDSGVLVININGKVTELIGASTWLWGELRGKLAANPEIFDIFVEPSHKDYNGLGRRIEEAKAAHKAMCDSVGYPSDDEKGEQ